MDRSIYKAMKRFRRGVRAMGVPFAIVGGILFYSFLMILLDPEATFTYNGVPTTDFDKKLFATLFASIFLILGLFALFMPARWVNKLFLIQAGFNASLKVRK